ncbi:hypothetical protein EDF70_11268 [Neorhizobium sp. JUb45]|nr:hypothetical protein EDF70_11268 [Neorhizobium sp. JUb45]
MGNLALWITRPPPVVPTAIQRQAAAFNSASGCMEDLPLVMGQHRKPRLQVRCVIRSRLELRRDAEIGAEEATAELGALS